MTDKKTTELPLHSGAASSSDLALIVHDPTGTPETRKISISDLGKSWPSGVSAGTYNQVTVDLYGHVTAGRNVLDQNYLINGGFQFAQRQWPSDPSTIANDKYGPDRWRVSRENADIQYARRATQNGEAIGHMGSFVKKTNAGKFMVYQIVESENTFPLRASQVTFQIELTSSSSKTIKIGIIELSSSGTADSIPATFVTAWNANTVNPTLGANLNIINSVSCAVSGFGKYSVTSNIPSSSRNIICAIWTDSQFAVDDTLYIWNAGLYVGSGIRTSAHRPIQQELALCQRYYEKSYSVDVPPGVNDSNARGAKTSTADGTYRLLNRTWQFVVPKRTTPTMTIYSLKTGLPGYVSTISADAAIMDTQVTDSCPWSQLVFGIRCNNTLTTGNEYSFHYAAESEL